MFGLVFIVVAFVICFVLSFLVCQGAQHCTPLEQGLTATFGVFLFILIVFLLRSGAFSP